MSDSESSDSDSGIRFKTTSTRHKDGGGNFSLSYTALKHGKDNRGNIKIEKDYRKSDNYSRNNRHTTSPYQEKYSNSRNSYERKTQIRQPTRSASSSSSNNNNTNHYKERDSRYRRSPSHNSIDRKNKRGTSSDCSHNSNSKEKRRSPIPKTDKNSIINSNSNKIILNESNTNNIERTITQKLSSSDRLKEKYEKILDNKSKEIKLTNYSNPSNHDVIEIISDEDELHNISENQVNTEIDQTFGPILPPPPVLINELKSSKDSTTITPSTSSSSISSIQVNTKTLIPDEICGPALPPHLLKKSDEKIEKKIIGPTLPSHIQLQSEDVSSDSLEEDNIDIPNDTDDMLMAIGPLPIGANMTTAQLELEKRALELKLAKLDAAGGIAKTKIEQREEWMLELPEVNTLRTLGPTARQFHTKERPDFRDRTSWTDTPQDKEKKKQQQRPNDTQIQLTIQEQAQKDYNTKRDAEQEKLAKKHKKKHKRDESLLDIHKKKLKKLKKQEEKEETRRPFSRDIDLQVNRFDQAQKNAIIRKAQLLDTRFSTGETKYL